MELEVIDYTEQIQELYNFLNNSLSNQNAMIQVILSLVGIIAICSIIRLSMSLYSKIRNKKGRK